MRSDRLEPGVPLEDVRRLAGHTDRRAAQSLLSALSLSSRKISFNSLLVRLLVRLLDFHLR